MSRAASGSSDGGQTHTPSPARVADTRQAGPHGVDIRQSVIFISEPSIPMAFIASFNHGQMG